MAEGKTWYKNHNIFKGGGGQLLRFPFVLLSFITDYRSVLILHRCTRPRVKYQLLLYLRYGCFYV